MAVGPRRPGPQGPRREPVAEGAGTGDDPAASGGTPPRRAGQYTSREFAKICIQNQVKRPVGSSGDCYDNAVTESFFATLECELLDRATFATHDQARAAIFDFIEGFYNRRRRHSTNGYLSPHDHETRFQEYDKVA
ncbi:hypothetical protein BBK14_27355 [Parafrankia soli]|uniref:Integrase catalytic domain-containing protein n=1 Tax=Parafrankia soli TaxID=2599596 RepID=A0A1S1PIV7_9ACTN|nr:hypothetical protein BBK14_27355 [Parafrankia soli]